jgi:hypothetical protein
MVLLVAGSCVSAPAATAPPTSTISPTVVMPTWTGATPSDPLAQISLESMLGTVETLAAIRPHTGWRSAGSQGEREALDAIETALSGFPYLRGLGLEVERQSFRIFMGTEFREARLRLTLDGRQVEVVADGLRGRRDSLPQALQFDSDGRPNDDEANPVVVEGPMAFVRSSEEITNLAAGGLAGKVAIVNYAAMDRGTMSRDRAIQLATRLAAAGPAGIVVVTRFANRYGESTGYLASDLNPLISVEGVVVPPTILVRMEDLGGAGIEGWEDLGRAEAVQMTWDADIYSPATSGNLIVRIPGEDPRQAIILGAHIDSPNNPGAMDDASGSAVLLEVARVFDRANLQPPVDLYLVWFGSEEIGAVGSSNFVATHQELLDRTMAMLSFDCPSYPMEGLSPELTVYGRRGEGQTSWVDYLLEAGAAQGVDMRPVYEDAASDSSVFSGFDVPNADLVYETEDELLGHIHDPYDTPELAAEVGGVLEDMARVALLAALQAPVEDPPLRRSPAPQHRALVISSHNEAVSMTPAMSFEGFGLTLAAVGFDVDMIPYGQTVTAVDLADVDLLIALPVLDYPGPDAGPSVYDEAWTEEEISLVEAYVAGGGLLVLTNSSSIVSWLWQVDANEDWSDANALTEPFGVTFEQPSLPMGDVAATGESGLMQDVWGLTAGYWGSTGVPFAVADGEVLAQGNGGPGLALVLYGDAGGAVLVLADVGWLGGENQAFWQNLAEYALER